MTFILPILFTAILFFDFRGRCDGERVLYVLLSVIAIILAIFAGIMASSDHVGASLSGMISVFMR